MSFKQRVTPTTLSKVERKPPTTLKKFDDSDLRGKSRATSSPTEKLRTGHRGEIAQRLNRARRTVPDHLLLVSLLEHLCKCYETDPRRSTELFKKLCEGLSDMKILPALYHLDEFSGMRAQYQTALINLLKGAAATLPKEPRQLSLPMPSNPSERAAILMQDTRILPHYVQLKKDNFFDSFTSRYRQEFIELGILGKGGFGRVYKVRNKLDDREYAVKKILLKENNPDICLKILREVKLLAGMHHPHIVGYNNAWLERVSFKNSPPFTKLPQIEMASESSSSDASDDESADIDESTSFSIIFANTSHSSIQGLKIINNYHTSKVESSSFAMYSADSEDFETPMNSPQEGFLTSKVLDGEGEDNFTTPMNSPKHSQQIGATAYPQVFPKGASCQRETMVLTNKVHHLSIHDSKVQTDKNKNTESVSVWNYDQREEQFSVQRSYRAETEDSIDLDVIDTSRSVSVNGFNLSRDWPTTSSHSSWSKKLNRSYSWEPESGEHYARRKREKYSSDDGIEYGPSGGLFSLQYGIMLYIQMQLCSHTLRDWLVSRNTDWLPSQTDPFSVVSDTMNNTMFKEILEGVDYIHGQGLMHRDLKPRNIFLDSIGADDCCVRIGDFGLAREDAIDNDTPLTPLATGGLTASYHRDECHTSGVGTSTYASPEQLQGSFYDNKSDMYSLGIILFELFHPFGTEMERVKCLSNLREGKIPNIIKQKWPKEYSVIQRLLSKESALRPSAKEVLDCEMYKTKDEIISQLRNVVSEKDQELMEKDQELTALRKELRDQKELIKKLQNQSLK
ncbi:eukaryotic translation initiation factor 2-alpha kinase 1-like isoform X2 [Ptychodera flava]|uniref:eukaryotic translation initiation factor 2-alpha kinase 1-like isoform X2 n=1 Tax=Ptychodera flava TaxID=63121 RepID=UPI00396A87CE